MTTRQLAIIHNMRPALRCGKDIVAGELGQTHDQISRKPGVVDKGFVDLREGRFLSRAEAARRIGIAGLESLDSQKLSRLQREHPEGE